MYRKMDYGNNRIRFILKYKPGRNKLEPLDYISRNPMPDYS